MNDNASYLYHDLINESYPLKSHDNARFPRMNLQDRAKIFAPFAALKGYEEAIAQKQIEAITNQTIVHSKD